MKLSGEARWKTLKAHLKELGWGPTTLKRILDEMVEEGSVRREARLSDKGAEVWYVLTLRKPELWVDKFFETLEKPTFNQQAAEIRERLEQLQGTPEEQKAYFSRSLSKLLKVLLEEQIAFMRACLEEEPEQATMIYSYFHDVISTEHMAEILELCFNYREYACERLEQIIQRGELRP
jgi:DNA-binding MarR family transcriptional regulator